MTAHELWHRSSYSSGDGNCVEVAWPEQEVAVRDSKQPTGPTLAFPTSNWQTFLNHVLH